MLLILFTESVINLRRKSNDSSTNSQFISERNQPIKNEAVVEESVERGKLFIEIRVKFSKEYFMMRYNLSKDNFSLIKIK